MHIPKPEDIIVKWTREFQGAVALFLSTGDDSDLRRDPNGRRMILKHRLEERRDTPLEIRRAPRLTGRATAATAERIRMNVLASCKS